MEEMYQAMRVDLKVIQTEYVSLTRDSWTSLANDNYETRTIHYINWDWEMRNRALQTEKIVGSHTSEAIKGALEATKLKWQLPEITALPDYASNEVKAFILLGWRRLPT